jgi:Flp pilus assembly protein TadG
VSERSASGLLVRAFGQEHGQVLPLTALMLAVLIGFAGLVVDVGRAYVAQRQLQTAVDAAALVAAQNLPKAGVAQSEAVSYSGLNNNPNCAIGKNRLTGYGVQACQAPTVTFSCSAGSTCSTDTDPSDMQCGPTTQGCNVVTVKEQATVTTTFAHLFLPSFNLSASSTAAVGPGKATSFDVALVIDSTSSMNSSCGEPVTDPTTGAVIIPQRDSKRLDCAKQGIRTLLSGLWPCDKVNQSCVSQQPVDEVSLLTFPALTDPNATTHDSTGTLTNLQLETQCEGQYNNAPPWYKPANSGFPGWYLKDSDTTDSGPAGYVITPLSNDYKTSAASGLVASSPLVSAVSWSSCPGGDPNSGNGYPNNEFYGLNAPDCQSSCTSYADAITAAQTELAADQNRGAQPVIILLSDGDANTGGANPCTAGVTAAKAAADAGTLVYSVMYGQNSTTAGCNGDRQYGSAYRAMQAIASTPGYFFCDPQPPGANCQGGATLNEIFQHILSGFGRPRLIP